MPVKSQFLLILLIWLPSLLGAGNLEKAKEAFMANKPQEAITWFELSLREDPSNPETYSLLAVAYEQTGKSDQASQVLQRAISAGIGTMYINYYNLGNALHRANKPQEAQVAYTRSIEMEPSFAPAVLNRGNTRIKLNQLQEAKEDYLSFLTLAPGHEKEPQVLAMIAAIDAEVQNREAEAQRIEAARLAAEAEQKRLADEQKRLAEQAAQEELLRQQEEQRRQQLAEAQRLAEEERRRNLFSNVLSNLEDATAEALNLDGGIESINNNEDFYGRED